MTHQEEQSSLFARHANAQSLQETTSFSQEDTLVLDEEQLEKIAGAGGCCSSLLNTLKRSKSASELETPPIVVKSPNDHVQMAVVSPFGQPKPRQSRMQRQQSAPASSSRENQQPDAFDLASMHG